MSKTLYVIIDIEGGRGLCSNCDLKVLQWGREYSGIEKTTTRFTQLSRRDTYPDTKGCPIPKCDKCGAYIMETEGDPVEVEVKIEVKDV